MVTAVDGYPYRTYKEQLQSIPLPKVHWTDQEWRSRIISELRPYFILPKSEPADFLAWIKNEFSVQELPPEDLRSPDLNHTIRTFRKGLSDPFWLLEKNEAGRMFYESAFRAGDRTSEEYYEDGKIVIGYNEEIDEFYSNSDFLEHVLAYFRGINEEDLLNESPSLYPIRTALAYANNLDAVLAEYSGYRGVQVIHRILHAESLVVSGKNGREKTVSGDEYLPIFRQVFSSDIVIDTQVPEPESGENVKLSFTEAEDQTISLIFAEGRLYFSAREYFAFGEENQLLKDWIPEILKG